MHEQKIIDILKKAYFSDNPDEKNVVENLSRILSPNDFFIDAGASLGQYTLKSAKILTGSQGRVAAFEPDPIRHQRLQANCRDWSGKFNIRIDCEGSALSNQDGTIIFHSTNSNVSGGLFKHDLDHLSHEHLSNVEWSEIEVPSITLDSFVGKHLPSLVKMDVEGTELRVLQGAKGILSQGKTDFLMELHDWNDPMGQNGLDDVIEYFKQYAYAEENFFGKSLFRKRPLTP
jgi:FkbM family methyltransferase